MTAGLADAGETVHVIAHRWTDSLPAREVFGGGRLIVHRITLDRLPERVPLPDGEAIARGMLESSFPAQVFSWHAALLAERLVESDGVDVIEAQEWEAPLYYFLVRRALHLGPGRRPPCVVHLHSSTEQIFAANEWDRGVADYAPAAAMEAFCIGAADALICPSRFNARHALARYDLDPARLHVIPYPAGEPVAVRRAHDTWERGSICHVGRLEARKGVTELAEAFVQVGGDFPYLRLEFVGADTPASVTGGATIGDRMRASMPRTARRQVRFHGSRDREGVMEVLSRSWAAVIPSRWDNLPYSCIEAMASGLPVITSPNGGMTDLVIDGVSGWVAADATPAGLATALRRALATPATDRARMGEAARAAVHGSCADEVIVARHLELKRKLVAGAAEWPAAGSASRPVTLGERDEADPRVGGGVAVVVTSRGSVADLAACLTSLSRQTEMPSSVHILADEEALASVDARRGWQLVAVPDGGSAQAVMAAAALLLSHDHPSAAIAFVDSRIQVASGFVALCARAFERVPALGVLGGWIQDGESPVQVRIPRSPAAPDAANDAAIAAVLVVRAAALAGVRSADVEAWRGASLHEACAGVARSGWMATTFPGILGRSAAGLIAPAHGAGTRYSAMARALQRQHLPLLAWLRSCPADERRAFVRRTLAEPARAAQWLASRARGGWRRPALFA